MAQTANYFSAVSPSNTVTFNECDALYVGGAGTVVCLNGNNQEVTFTAVAGTVIPIKTTNVRASSTATGIVALYG